MQRLTHQKVKRESLVMKMKKRISGRVRFVANKETKVKVNRFSQHRRAVLLNHLKQQTYQRKLLFTWMIIKKMMLMKRMTAKWNFTLK